MLLLVGEGRYGREQGARGEDVSDRARRFALILRRYMCKASPFRSLFLLAPAPAEAGAAMLLFLGRYFASASAAAAVVC